MFVRKHRCLVVHNPIRASVSGSFDSTTLSDENKNVTQLRFSKRRPVIRRAAASLEMIAVTGIILVILVVAVGFVGLSARDSFGRLVFESVESGNSYTPSASGSSSTGFPSAFSNGWPGQEWQLSTWQYGGICLSIVLNIVLWVVLLRRIRKERRQAENLSDQEPGRESESTIFEKRQHLLRMLAASGTAAIEGKLEVRHVMTPQPATVLPEAPLTEAAELMQQHQVRNLLVCDRDGKLCGLLVPAHLCDASAKTCGKVMNRLPQTITPDAPLMQALTVLLQGNHTCLAVIRDGIVQGLLTVTDAVLLSQALLQFLTRISDQVKPAVTGHRGQTITAVASMQAESTPTTCG